MAVRGVVLTENVHRTHDPNTRRVHRHEDLRLSSVRGTVGIRLHHDDQDLAARVTRA